MTLIKKRQELPVFGDMMVNLFDEKFFNPINRSNARSIPSVNIFEDDKNFTIQLAVPGMKKENFKIDLKKNSLTISNKIESKPKETKEKYSLREFNFNSFNRAFTFPKNADKESITAQYHDGILEVKIGKKEKAVEAAKSIVVN